MATVEVILDWMREHSDGFVAPAPTDPAEVAELEARGAPAELVSVYRTIGSDVPGLLPAPPSREMRLLDAHEVGRDERGGWVFAEEFDGTCLALVDGAVVRLGETEERLAASLGALLTAQLDRLHRGEVAWDPDLEAFATVDRGRALAEVAAEMTGHPDILQRWTEEIVADLVAMGRSRGRTVTLPIGAMSISIRRAFTGHDPETGEPIHVPERSIPVLRASVWLKWRLNPEGPEPVRREGAVIRSIPLSTEQGQALSLALSDAIAEELLRGQLVAWPGLGRLTVSRRRAFGSHDARTGDEKLSEHLLPVFTPYTSLVRALNSEAAR